jgi:hypothetical protein
MLVCDRAVIPILRNFGETGTYCDVTNKVCAKITGTSFACTTDAQCGFLSGCEKSRGATTGVCTTWFSLPAFSVQLARVSAYSVAVIQISTSFANQG